MPTELIVFKGQPDFVPIVGTQLLWASNTTSDVLIDTANNNYYVLLVGPLVHVGVARPGPWTFVASNALPPDFAKIPPHSLAGAVLPTVAGHAAGAGSGDRELDSADGDRAAQERAEVHAERSTARRSTRRSPARRSPT